MDKSPKFSVIIPCHNDKAWVGDAIESCLRQARALHEVIVIDDGSTDGSPQWLEERYKHHPDVRLIFTPNRGPSSARNSGIAASTGSHVIFLDSDDMLGPDQLNILSHTLSTRDLIGRAALVITPFVYFTERPDQPTFLLMKSFLPPRLHPTSRLINRWHVLTGNCFPISSCALARELLNKTGDFDPTLRWHEDWDFWIRAVSLADRVTYTRNTLDAATRIRCRTGLMSNRERMMATKQEVLTRHTQHMPWLLLRHRPFWVLSQITRIVSAHALKWMHGSLNLTTLLKD